MLLLRLIPVDIHNVPVFLSEQSHRNTAGMWTRRRETNSPGSSSEISALALRSFVPSLLSLPACLPACCKLCRNVNCYYILINIDVAAITI